MKKSYPYLTSYGSGIRIRTEKKSKFPSDKVTDIISTVLILTAFFGSFILLLANLR